jgi:hypothetical protein
MIVLMLDRRSADVVTQRQPGVPVSRVVPGLVGRM